LLNAVLGKKTDQGLEAQIDSLFNENVAKDPEQKESGEAKAVDRELAAVVEFQMKRCL
jgi:hypothetical protein